MNNWLTYEQMTRENSGGKAAELASMKKRGLNVPPFIALSLATAKRIRGTGEIEPTLTELYPMLDERKLYAVRSSANMEDGSETSFAGLFETYLNVSPTHIADKISACLAAGDKNHIHAYADYHTLNASDIVVTVIVQEMIPAERSGVLFTANPQGLLNESVLVIGNGLGEGIVNAEVPVTTYYLKRDEDFVYFEREEDSPLMTEKERADLLQQVDGLTSKQLDVEFAIADGSVYVLQSRPITTFPTGAMTVLNNSNLVESYPGLTQPLTESFITFAYEQVFKGVAWRFSRSQALLDHYASAFQELVVRVNGRMYYNMNHLYGLLQFLPFPKLLLPIWQEMMGFTQKEIVIPPALAKQTSLWDSLLISSRIIKELVTTPKQMTALDRAFQDTTTFFHASYKTDMSAAEVKNLYHALEERILKKWDITLVNDLYAFTYTGLLKRVLRRWGKDPDSNEWHQWFAGIPMISSMEPVHEMQKMAAFARDHQLTEAIRNITTPNALTLFLEENPHFKSLFTSYVERYGDRGLEELKLETQTFRSHPLKALQQLSDFLDMPPRKESVHVEKERIPFTGWRKRVFHFLSKRARLGIQHRETSRLNRSRIYGMVRTLFRRLGVIAEAEGYIEHHEDIFWLSVDEAFDLKDYRALIAQRKEAQQGFASLPAYGYLVFKGRPYDKAIQIVENGRSAISSHQLQGTPTSNGIVEGEVLVVHHPSEVREGAKDKILVTQMTDPGWVFLLTQAKGIIAEKGSLLSHTAIISRELGIPAVVGIKQATTHLKTGDRVILDGNSGKVTRKEARNES